MKVGLLRLQNVPIAEQLALEERLLRSVPGNWCLMNAGSPPAIVLGLSAVAEELVHCDRIKNIPLIRRRSGGGTVIVDEETVFFSLIMENRALPCPKTPQAVLQWCSELVAPAFSPFRLLLAEHDYVLDGKKVGGNAQYFAGAKTLQHTSFLWSWLPERMALLKPPAKQPEYRQHRSHEDFCGRLSQYFRSKEAFLASIEGAVGAQLSLVHWPYFAMGGHEGLASLQSIRAVCPASEASAGAAPRCLTSSRLNRSRQSGAEGTTSISVPRD